MNLATMTETTMALAKIAAAQLTPADIEDRIEEAWRTCKRLWVPNLGPMGHRSAMPAPVQSAWDASMEPLPPHLIRIMDQAGIPRDLSEASLARRLRSIGVPDGIAFGKSKYKQTPTMRVQPSAAAIDRMDEVFAWVEMAGDAIEIARLMTGPTSHGRDWADARCTQRRRVLWWRAAGCSWRAVGRIEASFSPRCSERHVRNIHAEALDRIVVRIG